jgi:hypothetical protein
VSVVSIVSVVSVVFVLCIFFGAFCFSCICNMPPLWLCFGLA